MAAIEIKVDQNTDKWDRARLGLSTSSAAEIVMMADRTSTTYRNYVTKTALERLTRKKSETYRLKTKAIQWGHDTEQLAVDRYTVRTGLRPVKCGIFIDMELQHGSSPDRPVGHDGLVQIKCPEPAAHNKVLKAVQTLPVESQASAIPHDYYWQMMDELFTTGREWNDFCSFNPDFPMDSQLVIIRVYSDKQLFTMIRQAIEHFNREVEKEMAFIRRAKPQHYGLRELVTTK